MSKRTDGFIRRAKAAVSVDDIRSVYRSAASAHDAEFFTDEECVLLSDALNQAIRRVASATRRTASPQRKGERALVSHLDFMAVFSQVVS